MYQCVYYIYIYIYNVIYAARTYSSSNTCFFSYSMYINLYIYTHLYIHIYIYTKCKYAYIEMCIYIRCIDVYIHLIYIVLYVCVGGRGSSILFKLLCIMWLLLLPYVPSEWWTRCLSCFFSFFIMAFLRYICPGLK